MVRFRRKAKRSRSYFGRKAARRSSGGSSNPLRVVVPALAYGAVRNVAASYAQPITSKIPLGNYADEALFGALGYFMAKKGKGMVKDAGIAILTVEAASVGNQLAGSVTGGTSTTATYLYG